MPGVSVTQNGGATVGTLRTELTGTGMTSIVVNCASGVVFDAATTVVVDSTDNVLTSAITSVVHTGATKSVPILALTGVVFDTVTSVDVDATTVPSGSVDAVAVDDAGDQNDLISFTLHGDNMYASSDHTSIILASDLVNVQITLTELQRNKAQRSSQYPGGDGKGMKIRIRPHAFQDIATNLNLNEQLLDVVELRDVVGPEIVSATVRLGDGIMQLFMSETVNMKTLDLSRLFLSNYYRVKATSSIILPLLMHSCQATSSVAPQHGMPMPPLPARLLLITRQLLVNQLLELVVITLRVTVEERRHQHYHSQY